MDNEINGDGRAYNKPGLYRHPESGAEVITRHDAKLGSAMSDAVVQVGFKYVGEAPVETKTETKTDAKAEVKSK